VVRRSIQELCVLDHKNDPATLEQWLSNKTPAWFESLLTSRTRSCVVASRAGRVCGFGYLNNGGEVGLLYVAPEARFLGASSLMLAWLEAEAAQLGIEMLRLNSTATARSFYLERGYVGAGEPSPGFGITEHFPLVKHLRGALP
jgi:GNAT superfamily N-acetyltransferase